MWRGVAVIEPMGVWGKPSACDILSKNDKKEWKKKTKPKYYKSL